MKVIKTTFLPTGGEGHVEIREELCTIEGLWKTDEDEALSLIASYYNCEEHELTIEHSES